MAFEPNQIDQDHANHAVVVGCYAKLVDALFHDDNVTFWAVTGLVIGKEIYDCNKPNSTGFSLEDIAWGYGGYYLVKGDLRKVITEVKF